jgi:hypothetical protein
LPTDNPHLLLLLHTDIGALSELVDVLGLIYLTKARRDARSGKTGRR